MKQNNDIIYIIILILTFILFGCIISNASAENSQVHVVAESDGGTFNFTGSGSYWDWNIDLFGFNYAGVDITNEWGRASSTVKYENIKDGKIFVKVTTHSPGDEMYYFNWLTMPINGNGIYEPPGFGGRHVNVTNSPNITGYIEYPERGDKAIFLFDTTHHEFDLKVIVHNGELLENATVSLINGNPKVKWTDEYGVAEFNSGTGTYHLLIEYKDFTPMLVDDLFFESDKSYQIKINMTNSLTSKGTAICGLNTDDLIMYYKNKDPVMETISPQGFVDYYADQMRTCEAGANNEADGTLQWMADDWGIYPTNLNVLLYSCNITNLGCIDGMTELEINYVVKNYQQYECEYIVNLIYGDEIIELQYGILPKTWSEYSKCKTTTYVTIQNCDPISTVYLIVESERTTP